MGLSVSYIQNASLLKAAMSETSAVNFGGVSPMYVANTTGLCGYT